MTAQQRRWLIGGALALTLAAMYQLDKNERETSAQETAETTAVKQRMPNSFGASQRNQGRSKLELLPDLSQKSHAQVAQTDTSSDLFKAHAWYVPPPPRPVIVEAEKPVPTAPPVPYFYMGKLENGPKGTLIFLTAGNKVLSVTVGQKIDSFWRLDQEDANALTLTYLPLSISKTQPKSARAATGNAATVAAAASEEPILNN